MRTLSSYNYLRLDIGFILLLFISFYKVKDDLQKDCDEIYSTSGLNQFPKTLKDRLQILPSHNLKFCSIINTFEEFYHLHNFSPRSKENRIPRFIKQNYFFLKYRSS